MRNNKIYTKKGDKGETSTFSGKMSKSDSLAEALGTIDELNSWIGVCRMQALSTKSQSLISKQYPNSNFQISEELKKIQTNLMTINSILAGAEKTFSEGETGHLERLIDKLQSELPELKNFIYPEGEIQMARSICRRAERCLVAISILIKGRERERVLKYINRLSDALFVMGRWVNKQNNVQEDIWKG